MFLKKVLIRIIRRLEAISAQARIEEKSRLLTLSAGAQVRQSARIINRQNNPLKIHMGEYSVLDGELMIMGYDGEIQIGSYTYIGEGSRIWSGSSVHIGSNVLISHNVNIIDTNSHQIDHKQREQGFKDLVTRGFATENKNITCEPIEIEDHAWINFNSTILKGVRIGKGSIIGPHSLVMEDVPPFSFYAGNPAKFIKALDQ
jgi:acetyltransferase-like isoleucine patch superfamily enzyme